MSLKFNGTSVVSVILKNSANPSGVNLKHLKYNDTVVWHKNWVTKVTAPTCETEGYTTHTCSDCGDTYKDNYKAAFGHYFGKYETTNATCTTAGYNVAICDTCGVRVKSDTIPALGHSKATDWTVTTLPTVSKEGTKVKKCTRCGIIMETGTIAKLTFNVPELSISGETTTGTNDYFNLTIKNTNSFAVSYQVVPSYKGADSPIGSNLSDTLAAGASKTVVLSPTNREAVGTTFESCSSTVYFTADGAQVSNTITAYGSEYVPTVNLTNTAGFYTGYDTLSVKISNTSPVTVHYTLTIDNLKGANSPKASPATYSSSLSAGESLNKTISITDANGNRTTFEECRAWISAWYLDSSKTTKVYNNSIQGSEYEESSTV